MGNTYGVWELFYIVKMNNNRNRKIKNHPEKFQLNNDVFNVILSCEERVYDQILDDFNKRKAKAFTQCHVINLDIPDNHEDADIGAIVFSQVDYEFVNQLIIKTISFWTS